MKEINFKNLLKELALNKVLITFITFVILFFGVFFQSFFEDNYFKKSQIYKYNIYLKHSDLLSSYAKCTEIFFPPGICDYNEIILLPVKLSHFISESKYIYFQSFNSDSISLSELDVTNLSSSDGNILNDNIIEFKLEIVANDNNFNTVKQEIEKNINQYLNQIKIDYTRLNRKIMLSKLLNLKVSKSSKPDYFHYQECQNENQSFKEMVKCGKEKRLNYCSINLSCDVVLDKFGFYLNALLERVESGEITEATAKIESITYMNELNNINKDNSFSPSWEYELNDSQIDISINQLESSVPLFSDILYFDYKNSKLLELNNNNTFTLSTYYYFLILIVFIINLFVLSYKIINKT